MHVIEEKTSDGKSKFIVVDDNGTRISEAPIFESEAAAWAWIEDQDPEPEIPRG